MTMWAAVIGSPIAHSLSPVIHRAAWEQLGIDGWEYRRAEVTEESLPTFIGQLDESFCGLSVTMPCKQAVMPLLDAIDPLASAVGAVNTVVPSAGMLAGFNTDVTGSASAIRRACSRSGVSVPSSALVLGARATASSALAALGELGLTTLSVTIGEEAETVETVAEPYLVREGFLVRTNRGRMATPKAWGHLGLNPPMPDGSLFD